jgi:prolyl 4-hydroxylase
MILWILLVISVIWSLIPYYPKPRVWKNFLTPQECDEIIKISQPQLKESTVSQKRVVDEKIRKSETCYLKKEISVVGKLVDRVCWWLGRPSENAEKLQVVRYKPGGFYNVHQDSSCFVDETSENERLYTVLVCLNDGFEGGETEFPGIGEKFKLKKGDALFFNTLNSARRCDKRADHAGKPVTSGEKWIANVWVRQKKYP